MRAICRFCHEDSDYICERCLRCEHCDPIADQKREKAEQHLNKWIWHRQTPKAKQLEALVEAGHAKGDGPSLTSGRERDD